VGSKGDLDLASVGVLVRFGGHAPAASGPYIAPVADVIVVPAPDLVAPAPSKTQLYCTVLDLQFDIDQEAILPEDKEKLAVVGTFMTKYPDTTAVIEGHTDNVGSEEHNQKLSQGRADHVVAYLVGILHIAPNRLSAVGYGKANPQVSNATEEGKRQNRRIDAVIACATDIEGLQVASARVTLAMVMEFDQNKADVKPEYDGELRKVAKYMTANPKVTATVEGHTANLKGTPEQLLEVSKLRAQNVVEYLVNTLGVDRARLNAVGYGDDRRLAYNSSAEGKQENRRVNIVFNYPK
jgi:OOP family OmpA-OmpF porin